MIRITLSALSVSASLFLGSGFSPLCNAAETGDTESPVFPARTLEEYLKDANDEVSEETPAFSGPEGKSGSNIDLEEKKTSTSTDATPVDAPKKLENSEEGLNDDSVGSGLNGLGPTRLPGELKDSNKKTEESTTEPTPSQKAATPSLSPELLELREMIRDCLGYYFNDYENVVDHSPWGVMHVLIAYGVDTQVIANNRKTNAIGYLCWNGTCRGQQLFYVNRGKLEARLGPGVQGHDGQFLAMMAQSRVRAEYPMHVEGNDFTLNDLIEYEKRTCQAGTELTFKLIGLAHYLDTDTTWKNQNGEDWNISRLIKEELSQPIIGAACGGTHRLMGFNYAVRKREKEGKPIKGQYLRARKFLDDYFDYTFYLQNSDGSFSTDFFRGRNSYGDINQRLETSGHILEWFVASLSEEQLRDPRVIKGISYLTNLLLRNRTNSWEIGPKGHGLHALAIYSERVFGDRPGSRSEVLSRSKQQHVEHLPRR